MPSTVSLQSVVNLCRTHVELMPIADVGGFSNEPALSLANDTLQELLAQPYNWKFNMKTLPLLVMQPYRQDYLFAGACAFTSKGGVGIDLAANAAISESGTTVTVNTLQDHNFSVGDTVYMTGNTVVAYNSTFSQTQTSSGWSGGWAITAIPTSRSFTFTHVSSGLANSGAAGITDFGWLSDATQTDLNTSDAVPKPWIVKCVKTLQRTSLGGRPEKACVVSDSGTGVLTVRFSSVPTASVWCVTFNYQAKAILKTDLTQSWSPFPDEFGFVYRQMFLARCYRYLDHRRADAEEARALGMIQKALGRDDVEESDQRVSPEQTIMGDEYGF